MPSPSAQNRLLGDLLLVAAIALGLIILLLTFLGSTGRRGYAKTTLAQAREKVANDYEYRLQPFNKALTLLPKWGLNEFDDINDDKSLDVERINARCIPVLEGLGYRTYFHLATSRGREYLIYPEQQHWVTRSIDIPQWGMRQKWQRWQSGKLLEEWWTEQDIDPRKQTWYRIALEAAPSQSTWSEPEPHPLEQQPSITGSTRWQRDDTVFVVAFDIPLKEIYQTISDLRPTPNGLFFLATIDGLTFTAEHKKRPRDVTFQLINHSNFKKNAVIAMAISAWEQKTAPDEGPFSFLVEGQRWWADFKALGTAKSPLIWAGIAIPEKEFLGNVNLNIIYLLTVLTLVGMAGGLLTLQIVRRHNIHLHPNPQIIYNMNLLSEKVTEMINQGESHQREFKSTMRHNLRENRPDKGIELAFIKTLIAFLNSEGGTLLIGVTDDGKLCGIEADKFSNDDKCQLHFKNLINQHVGLEYSQYIHLDLVVKEGKKIAVIQCEKSTTPVFLKTKNNEEFYIRNGPSNTKLTGSNLLKYLASRRV